MIEHNVMPTTSQVVIVGGGIMGCSLAYHLTNEGWNDVVLLEKAELTSGSTWHAAGQITRSTSSSSLGKCVDYNIQLYSHRLEKETGQSVSWNNCGSVRVAYSEDEMDWLRHTFSVVRSLDAEVELITPERIHQLHPFYRLAGILGGLHTPDDGHVDPSSVTYALAKGARSRGAKIFRRCLVTNIDQLPNSEWRVVTDLGEINCEHVVNAGGAYARQIGEWSGLHLPAVTMTHHYFVTDTVPEFEQLREDIPVVRDDAVVSGYIRMEQKSGLIGIYEKDNPRSIWEDGAPWEAEHELFEADYDRIMPRLSNAMNRVPVLSELGIKRVVHGAITHSPDGNPLIGPAPRLKNYWCCCGIQIGIGWGPALSRELARSMVHGSADISMREFDPRRFGDYATRKWQTTKVKEDYCLRHETPYPHFNRLAGRPIDPNPLYSTLKKHGAVFEEVFGHERPRWFAPDGVAPVDEYSFRRTNVDEIVGREVQSVRERAGIMDISAFAKVRVSGKDSIACLDRLVANSLPRRIGGIALTHALNSQGRIEIELIVVKLTDRSFYLVCAALYERRLLDCLEHNRNDDEAEFENLSKKWGAIAIQGPKAPSILAANTDADLSLRSFRWFTARQINVAGHSLLAVRISYVGEQGWELHMPRDSMLEVYSALWSSGQKFGVVHYGSFAMNVMRMEKAFKGASELSNEVTLPEADMMRLVRLSKNDFIGKDATRKSADSELPWVCVYLSIEHDGDQIGHGGEAVLLDGEVVGAVTSVVFSHTVNAVLAFAYVKPCAACASSKLHVIAAGRLMEAVVLSQPAYDPENLRPRMESQN